MPHILYLSMVRCLENSPAESAGVPSWTGVDSHRTKREFATSGPRWWNTLFVAAGHIACRAAQLR